MGNHGLCRLVRGGIVVAGNAMLRTWALVTGAAVAAVAACAPPQWPTDPVSERSEVTGRVWFCTPAYLDATVG